LKLKITNEVSGIEFHCEVSGIEFGIPAYISSTSAEITSTSA
jgi:hypothetical protein